MTIGLVAGTTAPQDFYLKSRGESPSGDMTGMTASLILKDSVTGALVPTSGNVAIPSVSVWLVRYTPDATDLTPGVYKARFKVTDSGGRINYFPSDEEDTWVVRRE